MRGFANLNLRDMIVMMFNCPSNIENWTDPFLSLAVLPGAAMHEPPVAVQSAALPGAQTSRSVVIILGSQPTWLLRWRPHSTWVRLR